MKWLHKGTLFVINGKKYINTFLIGGAYENLKAADAYIFIYSFCKKNETNCNEKSISSRKKTEAPYMKKKRMV